MKNIIIIFLLLAIMICSCSKKDYISPDQSESFIKFFGNSLTDLGYDVKQTGDEGYIFIGTTEDDNGTDMLLVKTDKYGNQEWIKRFGNSNDDMGYSIQVTSDGGFILAGALTRTPGDLNLYMVKTNSSGDTIWTKNYGGTLNEESYCVQQTRDGGYILTGYTESFGFGLKDIYLVKTNQNGDTTWTKTFGGENTDYGKYVRQTTTGYIIAGSTNHFSEPGQANYNAIIVKTNDNGVEVDKLTYGGLNNDYGESIQILSEGGYVLVGTTSSSGNGLSDIYFVKTEENIHNVILSATFGLTGNDLGSSVKITDDNGFIIAGTQAIPGNSAIYLVKTDANGSVLFSQTYGGVGNETGAAVEQTSDGGFIIIGSGEIEGNSMISLVKTRADGSLNPE